MPLTFQTLSDWLVSIGISSAPLEGPYIPDEPDVILVATMLPGTGFELEGAADSPGFQLRWRSDQNHQETAEGPALADDVRILGANFPVVIDGIKIQTVNRLGGVPAVLGPPDDAYRFEYTATYRILIGVM